MKLWALAFTLAALALPGAAAAQSIGRPTYGGPGCPGGTASASLSGATLSVRFSAFQAAAGGATGKSFDRRSCNLAIPVRVPAGRQVAIVSAEYKGFARLPAGARGQFRAEYFLPGGTGPVGTREFSGPMTGAFTLSSPKQAPVWSACGTDTILRTNASLRVTASGGRAASLSIRSADIRTAVVYRLQWRNC